MDLVTELTKQVELHRVTMCFTVTILTKFHQSRNHAADEPIGLMEVERFSKLRPVQNCL